MQPQHAPATESTRLAPSGALALAALIVALVFAAAFSKQPEPGTDTAAPPSLPGEHHHSPAPQHAHDDPQHAHDNTPSLYAGGFWNPELGLATQLDSLMLQASPKRPLVVLSVAQDGEGKPFLIDRSPIRLFEPPDSNAKPDLVFSIDHAGGPVSPEFENAVLELFTGIRPNYKSVLVITPLPAIDAPLPDGDAHDWTYLWLDDNIALYSPWVSDLARRPDASATHTLFNPEFPFEGEQPERRQPKSIDEYLAVLRNQVVGADDSAGKPVKELIEQLDSLDRAQAAQARWSLRKANAYEVIPALHRWLDAAGPKLRDQRLFETLQVHRLLSIHADALIAEAMISQDPALRALAARAIGELAGQTTDPLGKLTKLAEDTKSMRVRYEALVATRALPGRRAAGVAQLVEPYPMDAVMRGVFESTMSMMQAYGEPVPADSRFNKILRMPLNEALAEERDQIACQALLQRTDLPDDKVDELLDQLGKATDKTALVALLDLLASINPRTLDQREVLLTTLVAWKPGELTPQVPRLVELANSQGKPRLSSAAVAALIQSTPNHLAVIEPVGLRPVVFEGLGWLKQADIPKDWIDFVIEVALTAAPDLQDSKIAALDAIKRLPGSAIKPDTVSALLGLARGADDVDLRFAAIRAVNNLPAAIKPADIDDLTLTVLEIAAVPPSLMIYDKDKLTVTAGRPVEITFVNPDNMEHNLVVTNPGKASAIGSAVSALGPAGAAAINYVPQSDDVLFYTPMLRPGTSYTLRFIAPTKPGNYDYVCTYPGHWTKMHGTLEVLAP